MASRWAEPHQSPAVIISTQGPKAQGVTKAQVDTWELCSWTQLALLLGPLSSFISGTCLHAYSTWDMKPLKWLVKFTELLQGIRVSARRPPFLATAVSGKLECITDGGLEGFIFPEAAADKTHWCPSKSGPQWWSPGGQLHRGCTLTIWPCPHFWKVAFQWKGSNQQ